MIRSLWTGSNGLLGHQTYLDVIGNNIANTDTLGYRKSVLRFQDLLSDTVQGASFPENGSPSVGPLQVGNGPLVGSIGVSFLQGPLEITDNPTDLAITGNGFFCVEQGGNTYLTRAGRFVLDDQGYLVQAGTGARFLGVPYGAEGTVPEASEGSPMKLPVIGDPSYTMESKATSMVAYRCNLDSRLEEGESYTTPCTVYDGQGEAHTLVLTWTKNAEEPNLWNWSAALEESPDEEIGSGSVSFYNHDDPAQGIVNGTIVRDGSETATLSFAYPSEEGGDASITLDFTGGGGPLEGVTQFASASTTRAVFQNGYAEGTYTGVVVGNDGTVYGSYSNDIGVPLYKIALGTVRNPGGLLQEGENLFRVSANTGDLQFVYAGEMGAGGIMSGALEMSNVDTSETFSELIVAQRGYQASARIVTTSDRFLDVAIQTKR
ncbi:MAG TPA: flagellar hook protein FlgE [Synergistaceae bacterium]|nr:flagellar hook protein FlgE [Synergistaceae bacterium]